MAPTELESKIARSDDASLSDPEETPSKRSARSPKLVVESTLFSMLAGEFTSLEEPTEDAGAAAAVKFIADGPEQIGSERRMTPCVPTRKSKLPIARMIPRLKFANSGRRAGGCGRKPTEPK